MKLLVERNWKKESYTIGKLYIDGEFFCNTLEDKDRGLKNTMALAEVKKLKVYGETAIPSGVYELKLSNSPKFANRVWGKKYKGQVPEILDVKGFSGIRIHPLNTAKDSLGCIGVGKNTVVGMITSSTDYYYQLMDNYIVPATNRNEKIIIEIR
jgi:hypothetical protein